MKLIAIAAASTLLVLGTAAQAQQARATAGGAYAELGYTQLKLSSDEGGGDLRPGALRGIAGYELHPNVAVEGMLAFGVRDDEVRASESTAFGPVTATGEVKLRHAYGIYVKPKFNVTDSLEVFGRLGYTRAKFKTRVTVSVPTLGSASEEDSDAEGGASTGLGANYRFTQNLSVGIDYMRYFKKDGVKVDGVTVGLGYRF
ncbi:MAG TPA: porin family protein [Ramlibacter sp.]|jgi:outer membrane autotransporter protein|uniref:porin family protein n=1 Tax=Ramlibacter sp. TaxID=1917967 RepID=UPI002D39CD11|nr:porin family protein [Ramlibacter sp.]HZY19694.1 porin family protein [Ramlibacter sp.]